MSDTLVKVEHLSKNFCRDLKRGLWYGVQDIAKEVFGKSKSEGLRPKEFIAVNDVSFEVKRGECLGLIGHNGAGKSTLLKMLNGLIKPDQGRIEMRGRVGALIELGAGFNPILTGLENIYINGSILGFNKREIDEKLNAIIEFAEIGEFINTPVQYYSSGMKVRLGFAVASQMEPDILIIDEVLAVGDVGFRIKCFNVIAELASKAAVIFVSHNMPQIARISSRVIHLDKGKLKLDSFDIGVAINSYYDSFKEETEIDIDNDVIDIVSCGISNGDGSELINYLDDVVISVRCKLKKAEMITGLDVTIVDKDLRNIANCYNNLNQLRVYSDDFLDFSVTIKSAQLSQSYYYITLTFKSALAGNPVVLAQFRNVAKFRIVNSPGITHAAFQLLSEFKLNEIADRGAKLSK